MCLRHLSIALLLASPLLGCGGGGGATVDDGAGNGGSGGNGGTPPSAPPSSPPIAPPSAPPPDSDCRGGEGRVELRWEPPQLNDDHSLLTDLAGYKLYFGRSTYGISHMIRLPADATGYQFEGLRSGDCTFAITAFDSDGHESDFSAEASIHIE